MSNPGLISRMLHALDEYEAGRLSSVQVERMLLFHMEGVEGVRLSVLHEASDLAYRLVTAHMEAGMEEFIDTEEVAEVLSEMRRFLRSLPGGAEA